MPFTTRTIPAKFCSEPKTKENHISQPPAERNNAQRAAIWASPRLQLWQSRERVKRRLHTSCQVSWWNTKTTRHKTKQSKTHNTHTKKHLTNSNVHWESQSKALNRVLLRSYCYVFILPFVCGVQSKRKWFDLAAWKLVIKSWLACTSHSGMHFLQTLVCFFLLNMLWSRHVKPSPAIGEKSERSEIRDIKVCTDWSFPESVKCTIYDPLYKDGWIKRMQPKNMLRKNLPKALTAVFSPSRSANRAPPGSSSKNGRSHRRRRSECNSHVWSTYPPTFFFFLP